MTNDFRQIHGGIRIYNNVIDTDEGILNKLVYSIDKSKIWKWKTSGQAMYTNETQRQRSDAILPSFYSDYSALQLTESDKDLISFLRFSDNFNIFNNALPLLFFSVSVLDNSSVNFLMTSFLYSISF